MHLGPDSVLVGLELNLDNSLSTDEVEAAVREIETAIREFILFATQIFVENVSPA